MRNTRTEEMKWADREDERGFLREARAWRG
jgi:hypothetical protein